MVALYADGLLLFLNDADSSLRGALQVLKDFSRVTGLRVNWTKSQLLAIDRGGQASGHVGCLATVGEQLCVPGGSCLQGGLRLYLAESRPGGHADPGSAEGMEEPTTLSFG